MLILYLCTGCTTKYTQQPISYADGSYSFERSLDFTQTKHAQFYFETDIDDTNRRSCIDATDRILGELELNDTLPTICVMDIEDPYIRGNTLYMNILDWNSADYATMVLLTTAGQGSHYGLAYGYANMLCNRFDWNNESPVQFTLTDDLDIYDLNYLCFRNNFVTESDITTAQSTANDFVNVYIAKSGEAALQKMMLDSDTAAGMDLVATELEQYYAEHEVVTEISTVRYCFGGVSNDYIVTSDSAIFYICNDWTDQLSGYYAPVSDNFLHQDYAKVKQFFEINLEQMDQYRQLFAIEQEEDDLQIIFTNRTNRGNNSMYYQPDHTIYLKSVLDLTHEYIHALTMPSAKVDLETWSTEGFATYFSVWYDAYSNDFLNQDYNSLSSLEKLRQKLGRPLDIISDNDDILNCLACYKGYKDPNENYLSGASFVSYLIQEYGIDPVIQYLFGSGEPLLKSYEVLTKEWYAYLNTTYQNMQ